MAVTAVGAVPLHYQWKLNGTKVANVNDHIFGATTNLLIIGNAQTTNSGNYTVVITNVDGFGHQFRGHRDGNERSSGNHAADKPDKRRGNDCDFCCRRNQRDAAFALSMAVWDESGKAIRSNHRRDE